jgi:hypothetical protein
MNLHKCIVHPGIRTSDKFGRLNWFQRDLFYGLLSAAHKGGWFENNAAALRAALFAPCLGKVSERDLKDGLLKLREVGLIKLWTGRNGRAYGAVLNYRQKFDYGEELPAEGKPPDDELFAPEELGPPPGPPPAPPPKNRIEVSEKPRAARPEPSTLSTDDEWLTGLQNAYPSVNVRAELLDCLAKYPKAGRKFFENEWLANWEPPMRRAADAAPVIPEPTGFAAWCRKEYGKEPKAWSSYSRDEQAYWMKQMERTPLPAEKGGL